MPAGISVGHKCPRVARAASFWRGVILRKGPWTGGLLADPRRAAFSLTLTVPLTCTDGERKSCEKKQARSKRKLIIQAK